MELKQINITKDEDFIFNTILDVISKNNLTLTPRVAGGWVRDKLMGVQSNDIDIAIDTMDGEEFANLIALHLGASKAHAIKANPEKTKNISTAKAYLPLPDGRKMEVDFAQTRKEVYTDNSRNPIVKPGTIQDDCLRRDLTINSLFYNLKTKEVEDFSGKGISDLKNSIIRTPVDPLTTFTDDPLRILRVIRFAAKYNGQIDPETYQAMLNPKVREAMRNKIAKERMGIEIQKMMLNKNADKAIKLLKDTGLFGDILEDALKGSKFEGQMSDLHMDQNNPHHQLDLWEHTFTALTNVLEDYKDAEPEKRATMTLAVLTHDLGKLYQQIQLKKPAKEKYPGHRNPEYTSYAGHEDASKEIATLILQYLKLDPYIQQVSKLAEHHMKPHQLHADDGVEEKALRKFIRRMGEESIDWLDVFNLAMADAKAKSKTIDPNVVERYKKLRDHLELALSSMGASTATAVKPILNGNEIMQILAIKPGPYMKEISDFLKDLKDSNPNISKEEATAEIKAKFGHLTTTAVPSIQKETKQKEPKKASIKKISKIEVVSTACPKHLLDKTQENINKSIDEKNEYQATVMAKELLKKYDGDIDVLRLAAVTMFNATSKNPKCSNNSVLNLLVKKCSNNFHDPVLNCFISGILLLVKSNANSQIIEKMGMRGAKMAPNTMENILDKLPEPNKKTSAFKKIYEAVKHEQNKQICG